MAKWICNVCSYTHHGDNGPMTCPQCGASKSQFTKQCKRISCGVGILIALLVATVMAFCFIFTSCTTELTVDNSTVKNLDLNRFMGRWYEIARFDHKFERGMQQVTTMYAIEKNGKVKVINQGLKKDKWETSEGKGKLTTTPGLLRVSFWGPFYSDYRVMTLASDYSYALIGGDSDKYLWILSRTPQLSQDTRNSLLRDAQRRGYNTNNLIWVEQKNN